MDSCRIILISSPHNNSGKDRAAEYMYDAFCDAQRVVGAGKNFHVEKLSFATPALLVYMNAHGEQRFDFYKQDPNKRQGLLTLSSAVKACDRDVFIRQSVQYISKTVAIYKEKDTPCVFIIPDGRYLYELQFINDNLSSFPMSVINLKREKNKHTVTSDREHQYEPLSKEGFLNHNLGSWAEYDNTGTLSELKDKMTGLALSYLV